VKPPLAYYGAKVQVAARIAALLPRHEHYVEPFAGSLAVLLAKRPSAMETVNDIDQHLVRFWRTLRDQPNELIRACALTPHSRAEHAAAYHLTDDLDDVEHARRVWVVLTQGRAGTLRTTGWRYYISPAGSSASMPDYLTGYVNRMAGVAERLHRVSLECAPALNLITKYGAQPAALLFCDPPYLSSTRTSVNYRHEMAGDAEHRELADALRACAAAVVLCGYPSPLYDQLYTGWYRHSIITGTGQATKWSTRTEVLWSNRPLGAQTALDFGEASA
jgi:DNA adenine methylase